MSENKKAVKEQEQKVMTKYDQKMQKRKEQEAKDAKDKRRTKVIGIIVAIVAVCFLAAFPITRLIATNQVYAVVDGEKIKRVEFDYRYNEVLNSYYDQYGDMLTYLGADFTSDLSTQIYSGETTWEDFFQELAIETMIENKALAKAAEAEGYEYDVEGEYEAYVEYMKAMASQYGYSTNNYVKMLYGSYATLNNIAEFVKQDILAGVYYSHISTLKAPTLEEIQEIYDNNKDTYDYVDYRVSTYTAKLGEEPTEAEIKKAMKEAKQKAEKAEQTVITDGILTEEAYRSSVASVLRDWLFDESRKAGDTTVIEDADNHQYYAVAFEKRYLDETPSVSFRLILSEEVAGQDILDEWKLGPATEDSFGALAVKYSTDTTALSGGLYQAVTKNTISTILGEWLYDESRVKGETIAIEGSDGTQYVLYFLSHGEPEWTLSILNDEVQNAMTAYLEELVADVTVEDPEGRLHYLTIQEAAE